MKYKIKIGEEIKKSGIYSKMVLLIDRRDFPTSKNHFAVLGWNKDGGGWHTIIRSNNNRRFCEEYILLHQ